MHTSKQFLFAEVFSASWNLTHSFFIEETTTTKHRTSWLDVANHFASLLEIYRYIISVDQYCFSLPIIFKNYSTSRSMHVASFPVPLMKVSWPDGVQALFHSVWLRHNCACPTCWNVSTSQNLVTPPDLFGHPTIHSIEACGERQFEHYFRKKQLHLNAEVYINYRCLYSLGWTGLELLFPQ